MINIAHPQERRAADREAQLTPLGMDNCCGDSFICDWCLGPYPMGEQKDPEDAVSLASPRLAASIGERLSRSEVTP